MSNPQNTSIKSSKAVIALKIMLLIAVLASVFVIVQSCTYQKTPSLQRFAKGEFKKLKILSAPPPMPNLTLKGAGGQDVHLSDYRGKTVLLNIWATWCAPCVRELPSLDALQANFGDEDFIVIAVSMDGHIDDARAFYRKTGIKNLVLIQDPSLSISNKIGVDGIPISVFYNPLGREIARVPGEVDWQSQQAHDFITEILGQY